MHCTNLDQYIMLNLNVRGILDYDDNIQIFDIMC